VEHDRVASKQRLAQAMFAASFRAFSQEPAMLRM
jgi:hypothetical protein